MRLPAWTMAVANAPMRMVALPIGEIMVVV
jgi:hypothetical protein